MSPCEISSSYILFWCHLVKLALHIILMAPCEISSIAILFLCHHVKLALFIIFWENNWVIRLWFSNCIIPPRLTPILFEEVKENTIHHNIACWLSCLMESQSAHHRLCCNSQYYHLVLSFPRAMECVGHLSYIHSFFHYIPELLFYIANIIITA